MLCHHEVFEVSVHLHIWNLTFSIFFGTVTPLFTAIQLQTKRISNSQHMSQKLKLNEKSLMTQFIVILCQQFTLYIVQVMADLAIHQMKT